MPPISGSHIAVKMGGMSPVLVPGAQMWSVGPELQELDATTGEDEGYDWPEGGVIGATVNITFVVDIVDGDFSGVATGTALQDLKLYTNLNDVVPAYHFPNAKVFRAKYGGEVKGRVMYDCTVKSQGAFTENIG